MLRRCLLLIVATSIPIVAVQGCSSTDPPSDEPKVAESSSAYSSDGPPLNEQTICDPALVAWNLGAPGKPYSTCSGGVEYRVYNSPCWQTFPDGDHHCKQVDVPVYRQDPNACNWADSLGTVHVQTTVPCHTETVCDDCGSSPSGATTSDTPCRCHGRIVCDPTCADVAGSAAMSYRGGPYNGGRYGGQFYDWGANVNYANASSAVSSTCNYDLTSAPIGWHVNEPNVGNCGTHSVQIGTTPTWPGPCTVDVPHSCSPMETVHHLSVGKSLKDVPAGDIDNEGTKTLCMTDENNPINASTRSSDVLAKYNRLVGFLQQADSGQINFDGSSPPNSAEANANVARAIVQKIELLFEVVGDALPVAQQQSVVQLYLNRPSADTTPGCGVTFTPPNTSSCPNTDAILKLNAKMQFCARMASSHVNPAVRDLEVVKQTCVDQLAADIGALRPSLLAAGTDDGSPYAVPAPADGGVGSQDPADVCGFKAYRQQYDSFVTRKISERMSDPKDPSTDVTEMTARLKLLDRWYRAISANLYPYKPAEPFASSVRDAAWQHATDVEAALWSGVYRRLFPAAPVTASDGGTLPPDGGGGAPPPATFDAAQLAALVQNSLKADRAILKLMFPDDSGAEAPLQSVPLLLLAADAFEAMSQRMQAVGMYHDMGCIYMGCGPATQSELVWLMRLLPQIADSTNLQTTLTAATNARDGSNNPIVGQDWLVVYSGVVRQHGALEKAVRDLYSGGSDWSYTANGQPVLEGGQLAVIPKPMQHLAGLMQSARVSTQSYLTTGLFSQTARNRLPAGMAQDTVDGIRADLQTRSTRLADRMQYFNTHLSSMAAAVIQELSAKGSMTNSVNRIKAKAYEFDTTTADMDGLRRSLEANINDFGVFTNAYSKLTAFDGNALLQTHTSPIWTIDASSARAVGPVSSHSDISQIAIQQPDLPATGTKGTIVTVQVGAADRWTPTCAIQQHNAANGGVRSPVLPGNHPVNLSDSLTGPEGYIVTFSDTNAAVHANQTGKNSSETSSTGTQAKVCEGVKAEAGFSVAGNGSGVYFDASYCNMFDSTSAQGTTQSSSDTQNQDSRVSTNFASGMRLPNTPFPKAPVGALLAVVTDKGSPQSWRDVRVVTAPATSIVLDVDADVYLVTNDIQSPGCATNTSNALSVNISTAMHQRDAFKWVQGGLATLAGYFDALSKGDPSTGIVSNAGSILAQGRLTPNQAATIRSTAVVKLVGACNADPTVPDKSLCDLSKLPDSVREFITNYIDRELEKIDLKIALMQDARTLNGVGLEIQQMVDDYNGAQKQSRIAELIPKWALRNLDGEMLQDETKQLVDAATYQLYPILQLRYPDVFAQGLQQNAALRNAMLALVNAKWDAPINDLATNATTAAGYLYSATSSLATTYPPVAPKLLTVAFSRPGKMTNSWHTVAEGRAAQVWSQADSPSHIVTLRILPEDVYSKAGGTPSLRCWEQVPVLRDFAVVLAGGELDTSDESSVNGRSTSVASFSASKMQFPRATLLDANGNVFWPGGILDFDLVNSDWASMDTSILTSVSVGDGLLAKYNNRPVPAGSDPRTYFVNGRGLSPFTEFTVNLSPLYDSGQYPTHPANDAAHMVVVLNVEYRQVSQERAMTFIRTCN